MLILEQPNTKKNKFRIVRRVVSFFCLVCIMASLLSLPAAAGCAEGEHVWSPAYKHVVTGYDYEYHERACTVFGCGATKLEKHTWVKTFVPATETTDAYDHYECTTPDCPCEYDVIQHDVVDDPAVEPTCVTDGKTAGQHCRICGEVIVTQTVIPATGSHTIIDVPAVAPTCDTIGKTAGKRCASCSLWTVQQSLVPATGHTPVTDTAIAPTCTQTGLTEGSHCAVCSYPIVSQAKVSATGHTVVTDAAVAPTCTATGLTEGSHCTTCAQVIIRQTELPATGHTLVTDTVILPNCLDAGRITYRCTACGETVVTDGAPAVGHAPVTDTALAAGCLTDGMTAGSHCAVCGTVIVTQTVIPATGHTFSSPIVLYAPQPGIAGLTRITCLHCGLTQDTEIPALPEQVTQTDVTTQSDIPAQPDVITSSDTATETNVPAEPDLPTQTDVTAGTDVPQPDDDATQTDTSTQTDAQNDSDTPSAKEPLNASKKWTLIFSGVLAVLLIAGILLSVLTNRRTPNGKT